MRFLTTGLCVTGAVLLFPVPLVAQATVTGFDGTYAGVSRQVEAGWSGSTNRCAIPNGVPGPLTIVNGTARAGSATTHLRAP